MNKLAIKALCWGIIWCLANHVIKCQTIKSFQINSHFESIKYSDKNCKEGQGMRNSNNSCFGVLCKELNQ